MGLTRAISCLAGVASCLAIGFGSAPACSGDSFESGGNSNKDAGGCAAGQVSCAGTCVSTTDPAFGCGRCSACELEHALAKCENGACAVDSCQQGFADCDAEGGCEATLNTAEHCGSCTQACGPAQVCDQGNCTTGCSANTTQCGTSCVDTQTDVLHCGGCDKPCTAVPNALSICSLGTCGLGCNPGFLNCDGKRENGCEVNSEYDLNHCGACGNPCKPGEACVKAKCVLSCGGGTTECNGQCVDLETDEANCGDCDKACVPGQNCVGGECQLNCGGGTTECNGLCVDVKIDPNNCGSCGNACQAGYLCADSKCAPKCTVQVPTDLFADEFADNSKGWTFDNTWQIGATKISSGHEQGFPDPSSDFSPSSNNGVAGVVLGGNAPLPQHEFWYLTSPAINTLAATTLYLGFARWLNSDYAPYMKNVVQVYDGGNWQTIWQTGASPGITDDAWVKQQFEITQYKNAALRVRFGYNIADEDVFIVSGWNVDDVKITAVTCN